MQEEEKTHSQEWLCYRSSSQTATAALKATIGASYNTVLVRNAG